MRHLKQNFAQEVGGACAFVAIARGAYMNLSCASPSVKATKLLAHVAHRLAGVLVAHKCCSVCALLRCPLLIQRLSGTQSSSSPSKNPFVGGALRRLPKTNHKWTGQEPKHRVCSTHPAWKALTRRAAPPLNRPGHSKKGVHLALRKSPQLTPARWEALLPLAAKRGPNKA